MSEIEDIREKRKQMKKVTIMCSTDNGLTWFRSQFNYHLSAWEELKNDTPQNKDGTYKGTSNPCLLYKEVWE